MPKPAHRFYRTLPPEVPIQQTELRKVVKWAIYTPSLSSQDHLICLTFHEPLHSCVLATLLPVDIKNGMRNFPLSTRARRFCSVLPSNGRAPHTSTQRTTPRLCIPNRVCIINRSRGNKSGHCGLCLKMMWAMREITEHTFSPFSMRNNMGHRQGQSSLQQLTFFFASRR